MEVEEEVVVNVIVIEDELLRLNLRNSYYVSVSLDHGI